MGIGKIFPTFRVPNAIVRRKFAEIDIRRTLNPQKRFYTTDKPQ